MAAGKITNVTTITHNANKILLSVIIELNDKS